MKSIAKRILSLAKECLTCHRFNTVYMKLIKISLLFVTLFSIFNMDADSQSIKNYETSWKRVDEFIKKNLPKSALAEVKKIYQNAKKDAATGSPQDAQLIKSLVYITGLQAETREDNEVFSISEIEKEIIAHAAKETVSAILNSLLAEMYWNYYQQNRWDLYNRSETSDFKKEDISTWSTDDFHKKIGDHYLASLKNEKLLQQTSLQAYEAIIVKGNVRHLRPTLFDLLAQRALVYFKNDERDISNPAYAFEIDQASAFDPAADFINQKFPTKDSMSLQQKALMIYQRLIAFHLNDKKPDALIDVDLARIEFVWQNSTHPQKDEFYFSAINHVARQYEDLPAGAQAWYLLAAFYNRQAADYKPYGDTTHRYARVKAKDISEKILKQKDSSEGKINSQNLLNEINRQSLQFSLEKVNIPGQPFRALVEYKNFTRLFLRLVKPTEGLKNLLESRDDDKFWESVTAAAALRDWQQDLPATNDYQQHSVEIKIDALPAGEYVLIASTENDFKSKKSLLGARLFYVSNISFVNNEEDYFVLNRDNGQPLPGAAVQVWEAKYDYGQSRYIREKTRKYKTDAN